ncbi:hypothetical protein P4050_15975 [Pseudomonas aeruginosa]|nr:hypothetical protein [Pseudomonas aeruginosa]
MHGVDVPQEISEAIPSNDAVFLGYQRWFEDESPTTAGLAAPTWAGKPARP